MCAVFFKTSLRQRLDILHALLLFAGYDPNMSRIKQPFGQYRHTQLPNTPPKTPPGQSNRSSEVSADAADTRIPNSGRRHLSTATQRAMIPTPATSEPAHVRGHESTPAPHPTVGCSKARYPKSAYLSFIGMEIIHLLEQDQQATRYYMSKAHEQGSWGKYKFGLRKDVRAPDGSVGMLAVGIKEMRLAPSRTPKALSASGRPKTQPMPALAMQNEIQKLAAGRAAIDRYIAAQQQANGGVDPLGKVRTSTKPFQVYETIQIGGKVHLVTSAETGDLFLLSHNIPITARKSAAVSVGAQIFAELGALHRHEIIHLDIKSENIFFSESGQVKLLDFGLSEQTRSGKSVRLVRGHVGSFYAPEMFSDTTAARGPVPPVLTKAADVYVAGVMLAKMLERNSLARNPHDEVHNADGSINKAASAIMLAVHEQWRKRAIDEYGNIRPEVLMENHPCANYYRPLYAAAPELIKLLLGHVLLADPDKRAPATWVATQMLEQVGALSDAEAHAVKALFANAPDGSVRRGKISSMLKYARWDEQTHGKAFQYPSP